MATFPSIVAPTPGNHRAIGIVLAVVTGLVAAIGVVAAVRRARREALAERHYQDWRQRRNGWHVGNGAVSRNGNHPVTRSSVGSSRRATPRKPGASDQS
jgi:hypothetical protein